MPELNITKAPYATSGNEIKIVDGDYQNLDVKDEATKIYNALYESLPCGTWDQLAEMFHRYMDPDFYDPPKMPPSTVSVFDLDEEESSMVEEIRRNCGFLLS